MIDGHEREFVQFLERIYLVDEGIALHGFGKLTCGQARIVAKRLLNLVNEQQMILDLRDEGTGIRHILETATEQLTRDE
jgi:hypothetical protein